MLRPVMYPTVTLSPKRESTPLLWHPWVFSGAVDKFPETLEQGDIVRVETDKGVLLGIATFSAKSSIALRIFEFGEATLDAAWFAKKLREADARRIKMFGYGPGTQTTGYRVAFGEADSLPGIVIDRYDDVIVMQLSTSGADRLRDVIVEAIKEVFAPRAIVERSDVPSRREEGLKSVEGVVYGEDPGEVPFLENGLRFVAQPVTGQKTGFYLDQKSLRSVIQTYAAGKKALNLYSYTGAAGIAALKGGATSVVNVDSSAAALASCAKHAEMNGFSQAQMMAVESDVFQFVNANKETYGLVMVDPPAFVKAQKDLEEGMKAYHFLNRAALRMIEDGGIFVSSSCSRYLPEDDLMFILRKASVQAGVKLHILAVVRQAPDHPSSIYFPEGAYLKSFVCVAERR